MEMMLICASCRRRLLQLPLPPILCTLKARRAGLRPYHCSSLLAALGKPHIVSQEDTSDKETEGDGVKGHPEMVFRDTNSELVRQCYHGNVSVGQNPELGEEQEVEESRTATWRDLPNVYLKLSKSRLTGVSACVLIALVALTAVGGYAMAPGPMDLGVLLWTTAGTSLCSAAANSINQWLEIPYDSQMTRTKNRVLVRKKISPLHALGFGAVSGMGGVLLLWQLVNPLTSCLGLANLLLYTSVYTPLKRVSIINTWVGSVVGAIPPLMGWAACMGTLDPGALVLAGILYVWQFSHFNALSWGLRRDYSRAGYKMMSVSHPALCKRVALRYSIAMVPICTLAPMCNLTTWLFALDSLPVNLWLVYLAWRFYQDSDYKSSRRLFQYTLFHLPLLMGLVLINKKKWYRKGDITAETVSTVKTGR